MFYILEFILLVIALLILVEQVIIPVVKNRPLFPTFRVWKLKSDLQDANQKLYEKELGNKIDDAKRELKGKK